MRTPWILYLLLLPTLLLGQENFGETVVSQTHYFGINLIPSVNGDIYHFAEVEVVAPNKYRYNWLTRQEFILKASGLVPSRANPNTEDFFKKFNIRTDNPYWDPIGNLWRLRFEGHPLVPSDNSGWYIPNPIYTIPDSTLYTNGRLTNPHDKSRRDSLLRAFDKQRKLLAGFGIHKFSDFALGEKAFLLIQAVQDRVWIENYINRGLPGPILSLLSGKKPEFVTQNRADQQKEMQVHDPYKDVTIYNVQRSGLDQLLHGPKGKNTKKTSE